MNKVKFSAGRYYIGDPCYVIQGEDWDDVLKQTGCFGYEPFGYMDENLFRYKKGIGWAHPTAWGDGTYMGSNRMEYWVDSGTLGIVPASELEDSPDFRGGYDFVTFDKDFDVSFEDGVFYFGNIIIDTN